MLLWNNGGRRRVSSWSPICDRIAALAHIIKTWLWFIFRRWPDLPGPPLCGVKAPQCLPLQHSFVGWSATLVSPFPPSAALLWRQWGWRLVQGALVLCRERVVCAGNKSRSVLFGPSGPCPAPSSSSACWNVTHHVIVLEMGEGVIGFGEKTRNVHIIIISYLTVTQPPNLPTATSRKMLWLR